MFYSTNITQWAKALWLILVSRIIQHMKRNLIWLFLNKIILRQLYDRWRQGNDSFYQKRRGGIWIMTIFLEKMDWYSFSTRKHRHGGTVTRSWLQWLSYVKFTFVIYPAFLYFLVFLSIILQLKDEWKICILHTELLFLACFYSIYTFHLIHIILMNVVLTCRRGSFLEVGVSECVKKNLKTTKEQTVKVDKLSNVHSYCWDGVYLCTLSKTLRNQTHRVDIKGKSSQQYTFWFFLWEKC